MRQNFLLHGGLFFVNGDYNRCHASTHIHSPSPKQEFLVPQFIFSLVFRTIITDVSDWNVKELHGMSSFFRKLQIRLQSFMQDRNGVDDLGWAALILGFVLYMFDAVLRTGVLAAAGMAAYGYSVFRALSRNHGQRNLENRRFVNAIRNVSTKAKQFLLRVKNSRHYKYFRCPNCRILIRLARGSGEKTLRCPKCRHEFTRKA